MGRSSLRTWLLVVSVLFAVMVVGGIAVTTYVVVADGMQQVAHDKSLSMAEDAEAVFREAVIVAESQVTSGTMSAAASRQVAQDVLLRGLPLILGRPGITGAEYALYSDEGGLLWLSSAVAVHADQVTGRRTAQELKQVTHSMVRPGSLVSGLFGNAELGSEVMHVPVRLAGGTTGVLDVTYLPRSEEQVINSIRTPMAVLALSAMFIMVLLMQTSMVWVLNLVDNLRKAADSVEAGQLDARLPESGNNEIGALAHSINRLIRRLQRRSDAQARFVADASHELATPVAGIRGYTSILRAWGADDPKVRDEAVDAIDRESRRMARLTGDLLNLLHADQGLVLKTDRFDVNALVRDRLAATASRWLDKDIHYVGPDEDPLIMSGDPDRVEDVVSILLDNAAKYTPAGGRVMATTRRLRRDMITIEVADTGQGIPPDDLPRIFDRFFRSEASRAAGEGGFGLGLAIAKSIVESMGGDISVASPAGRGTTFKVNVPRGRL